MLAITTAFVLAAAPAPVYLQCITLQKGEPTNWEITLNEAQGTVDYYTDVSGQQRRAARYTADKVFFINFTLSRIDLSISRPLVSMTGEPQGYETGKCRLIQKPARAF